MGGGRAEGGVEDKEHVGMGEGQQPMDDGHDVNKEHEVENKGQEVEIVVKIRHVMDKGQEAMDDGHQDGRNNVNEN